MPYVTKSFHFCAAHQYGHEEWSAAKNQEIFGEDASMHGHNYTLEVTVQGQPATDTGFVIDLGYLKKVVHDKVLAVIDHAVIEKDIPWFAGKQPSTENMVMWIWELLESEIKSGKLYRIRLRETPTIYTDYYGPEE
ncbi:MAG: 6-pyruvoyl tetrahydropterin synthase family protein [Fidelibacterota bacterium]